MMRSAWAAMTIRRRQWTAPLARPELGLNRRSSAMRIDAAGISSLQPAVGVVTELSVHADTPRLSPPEPQALEHHGRLQRRPYKLRPPATSSAQRSMVDN